MNAPLKPELGGGGGGAGVLNDWCIKICVYILRFVHFRRKLKRHRWIDYRACKRRPKMAANRTNSLPNEEAIFSLVRRVYRAMTEEVPCERSRMRAGNTNNVEEEWSRNFQIPRLGAQPRSQGLSSEGRKSVGGDRKIAGGRRNQVAILSFLYSLWKGKICLKI